MAFVWFSMVPRSSGTRIVHSDGFLHVHANEQGILDNKGSVHQILRTDWAEVFLHLGQKYVFLSIGHSDHENLVKITYQTDIRSPDVVWTFSPITSLLMIIAQSIKVVPKIWQMQTGSSVWWREMNQTVHIGSQSQWGWNGNERRMHRVLSCKGCQRTIKTWLNFWLLTQFSTD